MNFHHASAAILVFAFLLSGCSPAGYTGNVANTEPNPENPSGDNSADKAAQQAAIERGDVLWTEKSCDTCHGETGDGQPKGSSILGGITSAGVKNLIVNTMPLGKAGSCDEACASDIVAYISFINGLSYTPTTPAGGSSIIEGRITLDAAAHQKRLYKAAMNLVSRLPTQQERDLVLKKGDAGFVQTVYAMMEEKTFYERLREIYRPLLIDDTAPMAGGTYLSMVGGNINWTNVDYADSKPRRRFADGETGKALTQEPMRLIEYIVKNNRPYTEILTADYTMVNYYSARAYNKQDQLTFRNLEKAVYADIYWDPEDYQPISFTEFPQAGLLTQMNFMKTYATSPTNVNRHRAYTVFKLFLDTDILEIGGSRPVEDTLEEDPTRNNPACTGCHQVMDPVASTFRHWQLGTVRKSDYTKAKWDQNTILMPGFNGKQMDESNPAPLVWLAKEIAQDPRFARATVKTFFTEMTGARLLEVPNEYSSQVDQQRYDFQQQVINDLSAKFIASGYNLKSLIVNLMSTDYFNDQDFVGGSARLLPGDRLVRKLNATTGQNNFSGSGIFLNEINYSGEQPSGIMAMIEHLTASSIACKAVAPDIAKSAEKRTLLPYYVANESFSSGSAEELTIAYNNLEKNIQNLMWVLWGETVDLENDQLLELRELYLSVVNDGAASSTNAYLDTTCRSNGISKDANYQIRGWIMLINLMIDDFRFYYE
ncbi:MAG: DUF1588 domain-containing protein [Oceanospirillaceae bacterium]|nr:DUF1588 domain-containing protein [Oceanospirillaceae bacterium]